jgi:hypothetical protein
MIANDRIAGPPERGEVAGYYFPYIDRVPAGDIVETLARQLDETLAFTSGIPEEKSRQRYESGKWSVKQVLNHVNDIERVFTLRALCFARGFDSPLPGYDENIAAGNSGADDVSWASHVEEFKAIRRASVAFFRNLPAEAWLRKGIASDNPFTVRGLAWILAGHLIHHTGVIREKYIGK